MKTIDEVRQAKQEFSNDYHSAFTALGNNLAVGIGKDESTGEYAIAVRLTNSVGKSLLPETYKGFKVDIMVIGKITAL